MNKPSIKLYLSFIQVRGFIINSEYYLQKLNNNSNFLPIRIVNQEMILSKTSLYYIYIDISFYHMSQKKLQSDFQHK